MAEQCWEQRDCTATWAVAATTLLIGEHRGRFGCAHSTSCTRTPPSPPHASPRGHSDSVGLRMAPVPPKPNLSPPLWALPGPAHPHQHSQSSVCLHAQLTGSKHRFFSAELQNLGLAWWVYKSCLWCPSNKHGPSALGSHFSLCVTMQVLFHIPLLCVQRA